MFSIYSHSRTSEEDLVSSVAGSNTKEANQGGNERETLEHVHGSEEWLGWLAVEKVIFFVLLIPIRVENQMSKRSLARNSVYVSVPMARQFRVIKCEPNLAVCNSGDGNVLADTRTHKFAI